MSHKEILEKYDKLDASLQKQLDDALNQLVEASVLSDAPKRKSLYGIWKGQIEMAPDFDEPLEGFKDYR